MPVSGRPFLEYLLLNLRNHHVCNIVLSLGYLADQVSKVFGDGKELGISIDYVCESTPAGTGGAVKMAESLLEDAFFVLNGDTIFDIDFQAFAGLIEYSEKLAALALRMAADPNRYGAVALTNGVVTGFSEKSAAPTGLINGGIYALRKSLLAQIPNPPCSIERDVFPILSAKGLMVGKSFDGLFIDVGLPEELARAQTVLPAWCREKALWT